MAASISFQATDTDAGTISSPSGQYTFTVTVASAAGQERLVAVGGIGGNITAAAPTFSACTVDGQTGTRVGTVSRGADDGSTVGTFVTFFRATGTSGTNINVVATYSDGATGSCFAGFCAVWSLNDADTVLATTNAAVNDPTLNTNTATGGAVAAVVLGYTGVSPTVAWTGLTERFDSIRVSGDEVFSGVSDNIASASTPLAISANITPNLAASIASICVSFNADAGGTAHVGEGRFSGAGGFPTSGISLSALQPDADSIDGTWTDQAGGTSLFAVIDEMTIDDADYIKSAASPVNDICKISLGNPTATPSQPFIVAYRYEKTGADQIDLGARLLQGTTEIAAWTHSDISTSFVTAEQTLSGGQFSTISDFNNLFIEFTANQTVSFGLEGDFSGDLTLEGDFSGSLLLEGT